MVKKKIIETSEEGFEIKKSKKINTDLLMIITFFGVLIIALFISMIVGFSSRDLLTQILGWMSLIGLIITPLTLFLILKGFKIEPFYDDELPEKISWKERITLILITIAVGIPMLIIVMWITMGSA